MRKIIWNIARKGYIGIRKIPIFIRLLAGFLIVILITGIFMISYIYTETESQFYTIGINYIQENLDSTVQKIYNKLWEYEKQAEQMATDQSVVQEMEKTVPDKEKLEEYLTSELLEIKAEGIFLVNDETYYQAQNAVDMVNIDAFRKSKLYKDAIYGSEEITWFNTLRENSVYYADEKKNSFLGNYITLSHKIKGAEGKQGVILIILDVARISGQASSSKLYNQDLFLADDSGIITYLSVDYSFRNYPEEIFMNAEDHMGEIYETDIEGKGMLLTYQGIGRDNWYVVSIVRKDNLLKNAYKILQMVWGVSIVGIGLALLICLVVTLSISYPLRRLKYAMSEYAQKDFYTKYEDMGNDQITQVGSIFKSMVDRIQTLAREQVKNEKKISEEKMKQKEMYLSALQMQINPHFLYNMLDLIRWNIINMENVNGRRVSRMISGYSEMLRYNIKLGDSYAKLWEELLCTEKYVKLLELLYDKKIDLNIECDEHARECLVVKLLLQPVIENTITHGKIHMLEQPVIRIYVKTDKEEIIISILNNGETVDEDKIQELNTVFKRDDEEYVRVGLGNVNRRIKLLFGEKYGLYFSLNENMTCVSMSMPIVFRDREEGEENV